MKPDLFSPPQPKAQCCFRALTSSLLVAFLFMAGSFLSAQIVNGGFEPPTADLTGWVVTNYKNTGLIGNQPFSGQSIVRANPGTMSDLTSVLGAGTDANVSAVSYPRFGSYCAVVNYNGKNYNANSLAQTFTLTAGMQDASDGLLHIRFAFLPVLDQGGGHEPADQPYFYVGMKTAGGALLYDNLNFAPKTGTSGIWQLSGTWVYTGWQVQDIALPMSYVGQSVTLEFVAAGCDQSGHAGYLYVDGVSPTVAGLWVSGVANVSKVSPSGQITYTYTVHNDSGVDQNNVTLTASAPAQTTLSTSLNLGNHGTLAAGASYTATMTVNVASGATGTISHNEFYVQSATSNALYGPTINVGVLGADTDLKATLASSATGTCEQVTFTTTVTNLGPAAAGSSQATFNLPANSTLVSASSSQGSVTGLGPVVANFGDIAVSGTAQLFVTVALGNASPATANATVSGNFTDLDTSNNNPSDTFTPPGALTISTEPVGGSYFKGSAASLSVGTTGGWSSTSYQWYNGTSGDTSKPVGGNSNSYSVPTSVDGTYYYWVRVTDACGHVDSDTATIIVYEWYITPSAGGGGTISPSGKVSVASHGSATFTITPNAGLKIYDVLVDGASIGAVSSYTFSDVIADHTIAAVFAATITTSTAGGGTFSPSGSVDVVYGSNQTFAITPASFLRLGDVLVDGVSVGTPSSYTFTNVTQNHTLSAVFLVCLTYTAGPLGSITGKTTQYVPYGTDGAQVTAVPAANYHFTGWNDGLQDLSRQDKAVTQVHIMTALFVKNAYALTYLAGNGGMISGPASQSIDYGFNGATVVATPNPGFTFASWSDGYPSATRWDGPITASQTVTANFVAVTYTVNFVAAAGGTVSGLTPQAIPFGGTSAQVTAVPNFGYSFLVWSDGNRQPSRTVSNVTAARTLTATFTPNTYSLVYLPGPGGTVSGATCQSVKFGNTGTQVKAMSAAGYTFTGWSDGVLTAARADKPLNGNLSVTANFAKATLH